MSPETTFLEYGLLGAIIVVLMGMIAILWKRLNEQIDGRLSDQKLHSSQMAETNKTIDSAIRFVEGASRE